MMLLYLLCLSIAVVPLFTLAGSGNREDRIEGLTIFYCCIVPILVLIQGFLLLLPAGVVRERPVKKRKILVSAVIAAIPMALLTFGLFYCIALVFWGEESANSNYIESPFLYLLPAISWLAWGALFIKCYADQTPLSFTSRITQWLLRGSILELLVAVPSHIISRRRDDCCAPMITLMGIATGLAVALLSFGPGIFFLFAQRIRNKKGNKHIQATDIDSRGN